MGRKQPKQEYKKEAFEQFSDMLEKVKREVIMLLSRVRIRSEEEIGLSAHADQGALLSWYGHFNKHPCVALIHGEPNATETLQQELKGRYGVEAVVPEQGTQID